MSISSRIFDGLKTNTTYNVQVRAKNSVGKWSVLSDIVSKVTLNDTTAPGVPTGANLQIPIPNFFILKWTAGTEKDLEAYNIYVFTSDTPDSGKIIKRVGWSTNYVIIQEGDITEDELLTITILTVYHFWVTAVDESGNESAKLYLGTSNLPSIPWPPS